MAIFDCESCGAGFYVWESYVRHMEEAHYALPEQLLCGAVHDIDYVIALTLCGIKYRHISVLTGFTHRQVRRIQAIANVSTREYRMGISSVAMRVMTEIVPIVAKRLASGTYGAEHAEPSLSEMQANLPIGINLSGAPGKSPPMDPRSGPTRSTGEKTSGSSDGGVWVRFRVHPESDGSGSQCAAPGVRTSGGVVLTLR